MRKIALIPAYEPDDKLNNLVKELFENKYEIIVVDDGSGVNYKNIFNNVSKYSTVLRNSDNKGKGYALKHGLEYIKNNYHDYIVVTMDSDGQHLVRDANRLYEYTLLHQDELVIGKRIRSKNTPLRSRIGNEITRVIYYITTCVNIYDTQTGLRCFSDKLINNLLDIEGDRYEYEMNVLLYAPKLNIKITEIEIETVYIDNNSESHFNAIKDSLKIYKEIIKFSLSSIVSFITDYLFYTIFIIILGNVTISNVIARSISASINYIINKRIVFKNNSKVTKTLSEYFLLALFILILNTILLNIIINLGVGKLISKIIVELSLFIISWLIQKNRIFKKEEAK